LKEIYQLVVAALLVTSSVRVLKKPDEEAVDLEDWVSVVVELVLDVQVFLQETYHPNVYHTIS